MFIFKKTLLVAINDAVVVNKINTQKCEHNNYQADKYNSIGKFYRV